MDTIALCERWHYRGVGTIVFCEQGHYRRVEIIVVYEPWHYRKVATSYFASGRASQQFRLSYFASMVWSAQPFQGLSRNFKPRYVCIIMSIYCNEKKLEMKKKHTHTQTHFLFCAKNKSYGGPLTRLTRKAWPGPARRGPAWPGAAQPHTEAGAAARCAPGQAFIGAPTYCMRKAPMMFLLYNTVVPSVHYEPLLWDAPMYNKVRSLHESAKQTCAQHATPQLHWGMRLGPNAEKAGEAEKQNAA